MTKGAARKNKTPRGASKSEFINMRVLREPTYRQICIFAAQKGITLPEAIALKFAIL